MGVFSFAGPTCDILGTALMHWTNMVANEYKDLLTTSPAKFADGAGWEAIKAVEPVFVGVGSSLVVLFFIIGFCSESVDVKEEMRFENILRFLMRLGIAEWFVANNLTIIKTLFAVAKNFVDAIIGNVGLTPGGLTSKFIDTVYDLDFGESIVAMLVALLTALVIFACSYFILYALYFRFIKILITAPLGSLASSTIAGNRTLSHSAVMFWKYMIAMIFEVLVIALALNVCSALITSGFAKTTCNTLGDCCIYMMKICFMVAMTVGCVKGAQNTIERALGLHF